ncbi:hypothetical protein BJ742DRAFT_819823 [Cladochytrium replicatum]|nr:hypothetical protein BJ742DRAFT_819823 [Cladochytrium replicatum]
MPNILIVGGSSALSLAIRAHYETLSNPPTVFTTARGATTQPNAIGGIDMEDDECGAKLVRALPKGTQFDVVYLVAGYFTTDTIETINWKECRKMVEICAFGPLKISSALATEGMLPAGAKVVFITSEGGSIGLRTEGEGGGNYGHHVSKAAANAVGKIMSWDMKERGVAVVMVHPGFMRTKMTAHYAQYYDDGGAVTADVVVGPLLRVVEELNLENTGRFIASMGLQGFNPNAIAYIKQLDAERKDEFKMGVKDLTTTQYTPVELPW